MPVAAFYEANSSKNIQYIYTNRNAGRLPDYHRLDIGFTKTGITKHQRKTQWRFGVYNLYNRANPYYVDVALQQQNLTDKKLVLKQYSLIPFLPYLNYQIQF